MCNFVRNKNLGGKEIFMRKHIISLFTTLLISLNINAGVAPIVLTSPDDYQVLGLSPNGRWATGVYVDNGQGTFGFLWNLESNNIQMLSTSFGSYGNGVSNDGTVAGHFEYKPSAGAASFEVPGYYKDGAWHPVELPVEMNVGDIGSAGQGWAITPDGTRMTGTLLINKSYTPFVWDISAGGTILRQLDISNPEGNTNHGIATCISPNGLLAGGWAYRYNRSNVLWDVNNGEKSYVGLQDRSHQQFNAGVSKFSPDGKKVIFAGGWDNSIDPSEHVQWAYSIYDLETGAITELPALGGSHATISLYGISSDYTVVGSNSDFDSGRAVIYKTSDAVLDPSTGYYKSSNVQYLEDYLTEQGVDFSQYDIFYNPYEAEPVRTLFRGQDISADGNVICVLYYGMDGAYAVLRSMVVMLNQDDSHAAPQDVTLRKMEGINAVEVKWTSPVRAIEGIKEYAVYRNGTKVATVSKDVFKYYDKNVELGSYNYSVASVYDDEETMSASHSVTVEPASVQEPWGLLLRQKGVNSIYCQWESPASNKITKNWYNLKTANLAGFGIGMGGVDIEMGVRFDKDELALYEDCRITDVNLMPMGDLAPSQLNVYRYDEGHLQLLCSQTINQGMSARKINKVALDEPLALPENSDVVVAFVFHVEEPNNNILGMDHGRCEAGYSDLIRFVDEEDFSSYHYMSKANGMPDYMSFLIDMLLESENADASADKVEKYVVYMDGKQVATTTDNSIVIPNTSLVAVATSKTVGVAALYENGAQSETVKGDVSVRATFVGVDTVNVLPASPTSITLSWDTPLDIDSYNLTYSGTRNGTTASSGIRCPKETNYHLLTSAIYPPSTFKGYGGYRVKSVRFYPTGDATFTVYVLKDGVIVSEKLVTDYILNEWNEVNLNNELLLNEQSSYTLAIDISDATPDVSPLAIDTTTPFVNSGDRFSLDSFVEYASWESVSAQTGIRGNWMIGMIIEETEHQEASIAGYDIYLSNPGDGTVRKVNAEKITDNTFTYDFGGELVGAGKVRVATYYEGRATVAAPGTPCDYVFDYASISSMAIDGVQSYIIYSTDGNIVRSGGGSVVDVDGLPRGTYIISLSDYKNARNMRKIIIR